MCWTVSNNEAKSAKISWLTGSMKLISPSSRQRKGVNKKACKKWKINRSVLLYNFQVLLSTRQLTPMSVPPYDDGPTMLSRWMVATLRRHNSCKCSRRPQQKDQLKKLRHLQ